MKVEDLLNKEKNDYKELRNFYERFYGFKGGGFFGPWLYPEKFEDKDRVHPIYKG